MPLPASYLEGIRLFNEGRYWDAHEVWEEIWAPLPKDSDERLFYQGLIQIAAALLHRERARTNRERSGRAALRCYRSGMEKLAGLPDRFLGMDLSTLRTETARCFEPLSRNAGESEWPPAPVLTVHE